MPTTTMLRMFRERRVLSSWLLKKPL